MAGVAGHSATITVNAPDAYGRTFVDVIDEITANDDAAFDKKVTVLHAQADKVIVTLSGPGGVALTAMKIGELIYIKRMGDVCAKRHPCAQAVAALFGLPDATNY